MRVMFRDGEELVLKEVSVMTVSNGRVVIESAVGERREHIMAHGSWSDADIRHLLRAQAQNALINLEGLAFAKEGT